MSNMKKVSLATGFEGIGEYWRPRIAATFNGQSVKLVKLQGEFVWHQHEEDDEVFIVIKGQLRIDFRDQSIELNEGELLVVPKGVEHRPVAEQEVHILLLEPADLLNTGNVVDKELTAPGGIALDDPGVGRLDKGNDGK